MHQVNQLCKGENPRSHQLRIEHRKRRFQAHDAVEAFFQSPRFFFGGMRRVIRGNHIHCPIQNSGNECLPVLLPTNGRIHFESPVLLKHSIMEYQIVWRGLTGHIQPFPLGTADQLHRFLGGYMTDVVGTACLPYQR